MKYCKKVCQTLKEVRKQIADANEIPYEITECHHEGDCRGTCPKCESELRYIENQLNIRRSAGKAVSLVGLSLGVSALFASCSSNVNPCPQQPVSPTDACDLEGDVVLSFPPADSSECAKPSSNDTIVPQYEEEGMVIAGDIEITEEENSDYLGPVFKEINPYEEVDVNDENAIFTNAEQQPEFPGGEEALKNYIKQNLKYPPFAEENGLQGRVLLSFIIEKDGSISNIEVMRSPEAQFSKEAIRIVKTMPKWKPGKQQGKVVRVKYVLPITFQLE